MAKQTWQEIAKKADKKLQNKKNYIGAFNSKFCGYLTR